MYQADAVARLIAASGVDAEVVSASPSKRGATYPEFDHHAASPGSVFNMSFVNSFDIMIVGGGGLLSAPHAPLNDPEWVSNVNIPIIALSLGAAGDTPAASVDFINKCHSFSVRDEYSREAVGNLREDVDILLDPILLDAIETFDDAPSRAPDGPGKIIWVPGKLVPSTGQIWKEIRSRHFSRTRDKIISFNPMTDLNSGFREVFPECIYLSSIDDFMGEIKSARFVASERYHAIIYALAIGVPAIGIGLRSRVVYSKISEILRKCGNPKAILNDPEKISRTNMKRLADDMDMKDVRKTLEGARSDLLSWLRQAIANAST